MTPYLSHKSERQTRKIIWVRRGDNVFKGKDTLACVLVLGAVHPGNVESVISCSSEFGPGRSQALAVTTPRGITGEPPQSTGVSANKREGRSGTI